MPSCSRGGLALKLRLARARTTRDVDVLVRGDGDSAESLMCRVAALVPEPPDHIEFAVGSHPSAQEIDGAGVRYHGRRFRVTPTIASRPFGDRIGVDVAVADAFVGAPDMLEGSDFLGRYGLTRLSVPAYPLPTHLAERLHALTLPRSQPNSRLKDLVDVALLSELDGHDADLLRRAFDRAFTFRASHLVPSQLPEPPGEWTANSADLATLVERVVSILADVQTQVVRSVNSSMLIAYWHIGRESSDTYRGATNAPATAEGCSNTSRRN